MVEVGGNLSVLLVNLRRVQGGAEDAGKSLLGSLVAALHNEVAGRLGKDSKSTTKDCRVVEVSTCTLDENLLEITHWQPR